MFNKTLGEASPLVLIHYYDFQLLYTVCHISKVADVTI